MEYSRSLAMVLTVRRVLAVLLVVVATVCAYGSILAHWTDTVLLDTPTFMGAIEPIVNDDSARTQAAATISNAVTDVIDIRRITDLVAPGFTIPAVDQLAADLDSLVRQKVEAAVGTDTFGDLWLGEMRRWHIGLVGAVNADSDESVTDGAEIRVALGPYVDLLVEQAETPLVQRLITSLVPEDVRQMQVVVFDAELVSDRLELLRILGRARPYLPWATAVALLLAFVAAPKARHALFGAGGMLAIGGVIAWAGAARETERIESLMRSTFSASNESAAHFAGTLFGPLSTWIGYLALAGLAAMFVGAAMMWMSRSASEPGQ
ncbi:MAG: hypothetical protein VB139_06300 [Coriobacteriia bacterium]|nr:hypothetical protein [Coriobacteriia bacterium]